MYKNHEAFCHMRYVVRSKKVTINCSIWNSRDGYTPAVLICDQFGVELQREAFHPETCEHDYKPKKGDLIWRDSTEQDFINGCVRAFNIYVEIYNWLAGNVEAQARHGNFEMIKNVVSAGLDAMIERMKPHRVPGAPCFDVVREDWT